MNPPPSGPTRILAALRGMLGDAQEQGFLGPGSVEDHVMRALDLARAVPDPPRLAIDLGSGGGVPGLPLALLWPGSTWVLLDGSTKRVRFLSQAVDRLGLAGRVRAVESRAETAARTELRGTFDLAVARGFAGPAVTAECGAGFLRPGGLMVVAEPPGGAPERWEKAGLAELGMRIGESVASPTACQVLHQERPCPERYPRRVGIPAKRPLW